MASPSAVIQTSVPRPTFVGEIDGIYVGKQIGADLFAEEIESDRYLIRSKGTSGLVRVGEVVGPAGSRTALSMKGSLIGRRRTLLEAARLLTPPPKSSRR